MITAREVDEYRDCDLTCCDEQARWEFSVSCANARMRRVFVCPRHMLEGFARARELA